MSDSEASDPFQLSDLSDGEDEDQDMDYEPLDEIPSNDEDFQSAINDLAATTQSVLRKRQAKKNRLQLPTTGKSQSTGGSTSLESQQLDSQQPKTVLQEITINNANDSNVEPMSSSTELAAQSTCASPNESAVPLLPCTSKENTSKESISKESISKESTSKESTSKENPSKESTSKETLSLLGVTKEAENCSTADIPQEQCHDDAIDKALELPDNEEPKAPIPQVPQGEVATDSVEIHTDSKQECDQDVPQSCHPDTSEAVQDTISVGKSGSGTPSGRRTRSSSTSTTSKVEPAPSTPRSARSSRKRTTKQSSTTKKSLRTPSSARKGQTTPAGSITEDAKQTRSSSSRKTRTSSPHSKEQDDAVGRRSSRRQAKQPPEAVKMEVEVDPSEENVKLDSSEKKAETNEEDNAIGAAADMQDDTLDIECKEETDSQSSSESPKKRKETPCKAAGSPPKRQVTQETDTKQKPASFKVSIKYPSGGAGKVGRFLVSNNRPYSITDLTRSFKDKLSRGEITKALDTLMENNIVVTTHDKKVYWAEQSQLGEVKKKSIPNAEEQHAEIQADINAVKNQMEALKAELTQLIKTPVNENIDQQLENAKQENTKLAQLVQKSSTSNSNASQGNELDQSLPVDPEALREMFVFFKAAWKLRKMNVMEVAQDVMENMAGSKTKKLATLVDEVGLDTDEAIKVSLRELAFP